MIRRVLTVLLSVLVTACAAAASFTEAPSIAQLALVVAACVFTAALQLLSGPTAGPSKTWPRSVNPNYGTFAC